MPAGTLLVLALLAQEPQWLREEECRHPGGATLAALAPATHTLATVGRDGTVRIWSPWTDDTVRRWHLGAVPAALEFAPDGKTLVSAEASGKITFWDPDTGRSRATLDAGIGIAALRFDPDGSALFAAGADGAPRGWDVRTRTPLPSFDAGPRPLACLAVDARRVAAGDDRGLRVWDRTGGPIRVEAAAARGAHALALSPDGKTLASGAPDGIRFWNDRLETRHPLFSEIRTGPLAFDSDGSHLYVAQGSGRVDILNVEKGDLQGWHLGLDAPILALAFGGTTFILAGRDGSAAEIRDSGAAVYSKKSPRTAVKSLSASASGRRLAAGDSVGRVSVWDVADKKLRFELPETGSFALGVALSPRGDRLLAQRASGTVAVRDGATGEERTSWSEKDAFVVALGFVEGEPAGLFNVSGKRVFSDSRSRWAVPYPGQGLGEPSFGRLGDRGVVAIPGHEASLRHPADGGILLNLGNVRDIAISPDGRFAATYVGGEAPVLWDLARGRAVGPVGPRLRWTVAYAFSPDGFTLATLDGAGTLRLLDLLTGTESALLELPQGRIEAFAFLAPGRVAVGSARGGTAILDSFAGETDAPGPTPPGEIEEAIRTLEADDAEKRKVAVERLRGLGDEIEAPLRAAAGNAKSAESKEALAGLLARLDHPLLSSGTMLRRLRFVQALERSGDAERLEALSRTSPSPRQRAAAAAALSRLSLR